MKKFLQIFSVLLLSCISVVAIGMAKPQLARADKIPSAFATNGKQDPVECEWKNTAKIHCNLIASSVGATYSLAVESSATAGHLVFAADDVRPRDEADKDYGFIHFSNETTFNDLTISTNSQNPEGGAKVISVSGDEIPISGKPEDTDRPNVCSITNLVVGCKNGYIQPYEKATESKATADQMATVKTIYKEGKAAQGPSKCEADAGALGFFLCPLSDMVTGVVKWALDIFTSLLELPPLAADNKDLTDAVDSIRNIANAFYVIIFLIIIFANFIAIPGLDNYSVKKLLPKLITVIILTQFSYLICSVMVDLGNIAGQTIPLAIATAADGEAVAKTEGLNEWIAAELLNPINDINDNLGGDIEDSKAGAAKAGAATAGVALTGVALYFFGFIIVLVAAVIIIISLFYLMMRWFGIMLLTIFAPIAFAAWVLPNTEKFAKMWITAFVKLTLMYVLVMSMLVSATIIKKILMGSASALGPFVAIFIPLIAIALVPKCLKVSSSMLTAAGKMAADSKAGKVGAAAAKKSGQEGKLAELKGKGFGALSKMTPGKAGMGFATQQAATEGRVSDAKSKLYDSMSTEKLVALSKKGDGAAKKTLQSKYQKKRIEAKQAFDAGITYGPDSDEKKSYNKIAAAAGGDDYDASVTSFSANRGPATQQPAGGGGNAPNPVTAPQPPPGGGGTTNKDPQGLGDLVNMDKNGRGHTSKEVNAWGKKTGGQFISKDNMDVIAANASDIRENLPPQKPLGPPPPPPGGSSTP